MATLQDKVQCYIKYDATKPDVIEKRICEGIDGLNATLSSDMTSLQAKFASARIVGRESNGLMFLHVVPYPSAHMYSMQTQVPVTFLVNSTDQNLHCCIR